MTKMILKKLSDLRANSEVKIKSSLICFCLVSGLQTCSTTVAYIMASKEKSFLSPLRINAVPSSRGVLVALYNPNKSPKLKYETLKISNFVSFWNVTSPCTSDKSAYWRFSAYGSVSAWGVSSLVKIKPIYGNIMDVRLALSKISPIISKPVGQGFTNWGTCTPRGTFTYWKRYI